MSQSLSLERWKADDEEIREAWIGEPYLNAEPPPNWAEQLWSYKAQPEPVAVVAQPSPVAMSSENQAVSDSLLAAGFEETGCDAQGTRTFRKVVRSRVEIRQRSDAEEWITEPEKPFWNPPPAKFFEQAEQTMQEHEEPLSGVQYVYASARRPYARLYANVVRGNWSGWY